MTYSLYPTKSLEKSLTVAIFFTNSGRRGEDHYEFNGILAVRYETQNYIQYRVTGAQ